jgi:hypothetical protein
MEEDEAWSDEEECRRSGNVNSHGRCIPETVGITSGGWRGIEWVASGH